jgi:hypothetical protein
MPAKTIREARAARLEFHDRYGKDLSLTDGDTRLFWADGRYELRLQLKDEPQLEIPSVFEGLPIRVEMVKGHAKIGGAKG